MRSINQLTKPLAIALVCLFALSRTAQGQQSHRSINTSISDDNKAYAISIDGVIDGRAIHYQRQFDVAGMSQTEKDAIKTRVFDSLGLTESPKPLDPPTPLTPQEPASIADADESDAVEQTVTFVCPDCTGKIRLEVVGTNFEFTRDATAKNPESRIFPLTVNMIPGEYRYQYWQNGVLQLQLPFTVKADETNQVSIK